MCDTKMRDRMTVHCINDLDINVPYIMKRTLKETHAKVGTW